MEPLIIIPTYWTRRRAAAPEDPLLVYDHPTPIDAHGTLPRCLASLRGVSGVGRILILAAADHSSIEFRAEDRVRAIAEEFSDLDIVVFGATELGMLHRRLEQLEMGAFVDGVGLRGYGAVRNTGLLVASILGHDLVTFIDDDEVIIDREFFVRAFEGFGQTVVENGQTMLVKTGYYVGESGEWDPKTEKHWYDRWWGKTEAFNKWMRSALSGSRFKRSNTACGGSLVMHKTAFRRIPFDPWVVRGEDIDYIISSRMLGLDVYFDNELRIQHLSAPKSRNEAQRFRQNIYRWVYEQRKIEYARSQVDLLQVKPHSLDPYPGPFLDSSVGRRAINTAFMRALGRSDTKGYLAVARKALREASDFATSNCDRYFELLKVWPSITEYLSDDAALKPLLLGERHVDRDTLTGRFPVVGSANGQSEDTDEAHTSATEGTVRTEIGTNDGPAASE